MSGEIDPRVHRLELVISIILRTGVIISFLLVAAGLALTLAQHPDWARGSVPIGEFLAHHGSGFHRWGDVAAGLAKGDGRAVAMLGLLILVSTPITRVAVSIGLFAYLHDRPFVWITFLVFVLLMVSVFIGHAEM